VVVVFLLEFDVSGKRVCRKSKPEETKPSRILKLGVSIVVEEIKRHQNLEQLQVVFLSEFPTILIPTSLLGK
jgi:hypothetical protein